MRTLRPLSLAAMLASLNSTAALAQTSAAPAPAPAPATVPATDGGAETKPVQDARIFAHLLFDQLEGRFDGSKADFRWDGQGWIGTDTDKFWIKSEGFRRANDKVDDGRHEFLYDRAITTYWDLQAGLRSDIDSRPTRNWAAFGVQGLAPLFFDFEATGYVSDRGHFAGRVQAYYDLLITQRLVFQPELEINLYSKPDPVRLVGAGFSDLDAGLRLRYELDRKFAPYIGVAFENKFGETAGFARRAGEGTHGVRFLLGVRAWY